LVKSILLFGMWLAFFDTEPQITDNIASQHIFN